MTTTNENGTPEGPKIPEHPGAWMRRIGRLQRENMHEKRRAHERERRRAERLERREAIDAIAREGISDEDYATTMATLERMARNLGWSEEREAEEHHHHHHDRHPHGHHRGPWGRRARWAMASAQSHHGC